MRRELWFVHISRGCKFKRAAQVSDAKGGAQFAGEIGKLGQTARPADSAARTRGPNRTTTKDTRAQMTDIADLQARITAALDRIGSGLESLAKAPEPGAADASEVTELREALEEERTTNAQLEERVRAIKEQQETALEGLVSEVDRLSTLLESEEAAAARLVKVNAELRANNAALREAIAKGVAEPHLVNKSMMAELEGLRAAQAADRAELDAVLGELDALVSQAAAAPEDLEESTDA